MLGPERRDTILRLLNEEGRVLASDLAPRLGVSLDTVRRDLDGLATVGALRRVHGGALPSSTSPRPLPRPRAPRPRRPAPGGGPRARPGRRAAVVAAAAPFRRPP